ncbi:tetratricopeptide repeat protein [Lacrimispora indolis]|uniref:tetratricopeptide repeat protein n=1 Tax=Lacrimispora indolis TaxID=69825 RepID=UPI000419EEC4|nr:tetratricopeptide repeat protein [[Clostridium] methoxybenzovorans]
MDKYEFNIKVEQIKKLVGKNDYETAMKIADTIDWKRVRNTNLLSMVAMVYEKNEDYQEAKDILLQAFERAPIGKRLLYKLAELAIKEGNIEEAEAYYKEFGDLASDDPRQQLLRYMILKAKGAPAQQLIHSLESYTSVELDEKWLYELAELYSLAGMPDRCVETCDRIMLMFGLGKYVDKAMDLKIQYAPLTNYQMDLVENRDKYEAKLRAVEQEYSAGKRPSQEPEPEEEYYEEEPEPVMTFGENPMEDNLEARLQDAAVQENLAREMSRISYEEPIIQEESRLEHTRVLEDIRRVGSPITPMPGTRGIYASENEDSLFHHPEPVFEEEEPEGPGMEESSLEGQYDREIEYEEPDDAGQLSAITSEGFQESDDQPEDDYGYEENDYDQPDESYYEKEEVTETPYASLNQASEEDAPAWNQDFRNFGDEESLEFEDLYEGEEDESEETPVQNHLMIEARTPEKGLQMAVEALKQIHNESGVKNPVAKINGSKLSKRGVLASADRLAGKDLIIEEAGDLTREALTELNELMDRDTSGMIVVLIDNPKQMETLHQEHPLLASKFECIGTGEGTPAFCISEPVREERPVKVPEAPVYKPFTPAPKEEELREESYEANQEYRYEYDSWQENNYGENSDYEEGVHEDDDFYEEDEEFRPSVRDEEGPGFQGEEMDIDEFAQYACRYANEIDCSITGKSMLALYERIEIMEEDGLPLNRANAESLIEEAADRAEKPSLGKRIKGLFSTKYDKDGLLVLKEEHFIY